MGINVASVRKGLQAFDLQRLFVEELGWDRHNATLEIPVDGRTYPMSALAQKRGMIAFVCKPADDGQMPSYAERRRIDRVVAKTHFEHLIVYVDPAKTTQIWQWIKREHGKPAASREHTWHKSQPGDALIQKLDNIAFTLEEEESIGGIGDVTSRVRAGFDLERVTKRFYDRFKTEHDAFLRFIKGIPDEEMHRWYVSVMLNRLMFIYFIQKKGFLNGDLAYLRTKLNASKQAGKDRFYKTVLCPLFFEGFAVKEEERSAATNELLGKVPYLNGGLFLRHQIEEHCGEKIQVADAAFEQIFDFFDAYQWHLDERPLRQDDEINPDVLGYIFEKYINQKQMGAYYTKEDITEYIAKNTVIPFLFDEAKKECPIAFTEDSFLWKLLREDPDRYIYEAVRKGVIDSQSKVVPLPREIEAGVNEVAKRGGWNKPADASFALPTETWREHFARRQRCLELRRKLREGEIHEINDLIILNLDIRQFAQDVLVNSEGPELVRAFYQAIERVTVLDPACGSGAFLFAALNVLQPLYEACLERMAAFLAEAERGKSSLRPERFADFRKTLERIKLHPNHDYFVLKSIIVNNLYGVDIMEEAVEICKLRLFLKLVAQLEPADKIEPLPDIDFNIRPGNTLVGYAAHAETRQTLNFGDAWTRIEQRAADVDRRFQEFRQRQTGDEWQISGKLALVLKQAILKPMEELRRELDQFLALTYGQAGKGKFEAWRRSHQPFHWFAEFYSIIHGGGFAVIIGNPPYVEYAKIKKFYTVRGYRTESCGNLYAFMWERCLAIARSGGRIGMIQPVAAVCTEGYQPLQAALRDMGSSVVSNFNDRPSKLFDGLEHIRLCIILHHKGLDRSTFATTYNKWQSAERNHLFQRLSFHDTTRLNTGASIAKIGSSLEGSILAKLAKEKGLIGEYERDGKSAIYYTRKLSHFVQILDFVPVIKDASGHKREPSELKQITFTSKDQRDVFLAILNSSLFYWLLTVYSDCRNLNRRDIGVARFDFDSGGANDVGALVTLSHKLMEDIRAKAKVLTMNYKELGELRIQCTYPKLSKPIIDDIDRLLAKHFGFTDNEADFIINHDIKYRMGADGGGNDDAD